MNKWFGTPWNPSCCTEDAQVPVPVGRMCDHCGERIEIKDSGYIAGGTYHLECWLRTAFGSVGHNLGLCSCTSSQRIKLGIFPGVSFEDLPNLTKRENARAAADAAQYKNTPGSLEVFIKWAQLSLEREPKDKSPTIRFDL